MRYIVDAASMRRADLVTQTEFGMEGAVLMERAALCVCDEIAGWWDEHPHGKRACEVLIFSGSGNNGGDGVAAGRILMQRGYSVRVVLAGTGARSAGLDGQLRTAECYGVDISVCADEQALTDILSKKAVPTPDVIVDAMLGIGCTRAVTGVYAACTDYIDEVKSRRGSDLYVVAVDIPTGIDSDDGSVHGAAVHADVTVTFAWEKQGLVLYPGCTYAGRVICRDIGITEAAFQGDMPGTAVMDEPVDALLPARDPSGNKGSFGKVLVAAGSAEVSGAAILCAETAMRSGAGMVRVLTHENAAQAIRLGLPEVLLSVYTDATDVDVLVRQAMAWADTVVAGPGIGTDLRALTMLRAILTEELRGYTESGGTGRHHGLVLDADALNCIAGDEELRALITDIGRRGGSVILTPHVAEFARLYGGVDAAAVHAGILSLPRKLADELQAVVVCKDSRTVIVSPDEPVQLLNTAGNDGMATAGSGDVLAGIIGALYAGGLDAFHSAANGVRLHALAGDAAAGELGRRAMTAVDIMEYGYRMIGGVA